MTRLIGELCQVPVRSDSTRRGKHLINSSILVGLELEVEAVNRGSINTYPAPNGWAYRQDGSLRNSGIELVMDEPVSGVLLEGRILRLQEAMARIEVLQKYPVQYNWRTSLHCHLNFSDKTQTQLYSSMMIFLIFERLLMRYCGVLREENIFCIPTYKCASHLDVFRDFLFSGKLRTNDDYKYCAINIAALRKFGTIEFRMHQGTHNAEEIFEWLNILFSMINHSEKVIKNKELLNLPQIMSEQGPYNYGKIVFGDYWDKLIKDLSPRQVDRMILRGVRDCQGFIYDQRNPFINEL